jgi:protein-S-isoprenylcysteine O-methyltransferase Ste14
MLLKIGKISRRILAGLLAFFNVVPSLTVIFNPLLFIMFFPLGMYAVLTWPWPILKDIPDPFHLGESLYWLTYVLKVQDDVILHSLFGLGFTLAAVGSAIFLAAFIKWLSSLRKGGLITRGIYRVVRHPQYFGIIVLTLGISIRALRPVSFIAWLTLAFGYLILASVEEKGLLKTYGEKYVEYAETVPFMVPFLKLKLPGFLSSQRPYRYILLLALWITLTVALIISTRNMVLALRGSF